MTKLLISKFVNYVAIALFVAPIWAHDRAPKAMDPNDGWQDRNGRIQVLRKRILIGELVAFMDRDGHTPAPQRSVHVERHDHRTWLVVDTPRRTVAVRPNVLVLLIAASMARRRERS